MKLKNPTGHLFACALLLSAVTTASFVPRTPTVLRGTVLDRKCAFLKNEYMSDMVVEFGSSTESQTIIPAHKLIFAYHSSVFEAALNKTAPANESKQRFVIRNIDAETLDILLR